MEKRLSRWYGQVVRLARWEALALASVIVDVRVTQLANGVVGCHAVLPRDAFVSL
jgi:acetamidase/formamidase